MIGRTLAHYEITAEIGAGGMGIVYRARDTRLGRDVALKFLPEEVAGDPERVARFRREARILATLQHPGIAAIHGLEEADGHVFCILEFVRGETLGRRLKKGTVPLPEALRLLREIAAALAAAHEHGILHRDVKPENLMIEPEGRVKVLDFGLAKSFVARESDRTGPPGTTITAPLTLPGTIQGTVNYMSPEQARGEEVDRRTDVWSFGCVMYDLLAGRRAFDDPTPTDVIAAILKDEPDWSQLPSEVPERVRHLLQRCLRKDRARRLHDLADAQIELDEVLESQEHPDREPALKPRPRWGRLPLAAIGIVFLALLGFAGRSILRRSDPDEKQVYHLTLTLPESTPLAVQDAGALAISPDGRKLVFVTADETGSALYLRELDKPNPRSLAGTEGGCQPFFAPDGASIGFFAHGLLKRLPLDGGAAIPICEAEGPRGGSWSEDGEIVFAAGDSGSGLFRVAATGGVPRAIALRTPDAQRERISWPSFLPGGESILAVVGTGFSYEPMNIARIDLEEGRLKILAEGDMAPVYHPSGFVVATRGRSLIGLPFEPRKKSPVGDPFVASEDLWALVVPQYALARNGTLVYALEGANRGEGGEWTDRTPVWVDSQGKLTPLGAPARAYTLPSLSPDGSFVAFSVLGEKTIENWVYSVERGTLSRLTRRGNEHLPIWTPDARRIIFASDVAGGAPNLYWMAADGTGEAQRLTWSDYHQCPSSVSPDGRYLSYTEARAGNATDIYLLDLAGDLVPRPFAVSASNDRQGMISPDGGWIAYTSDRSGVEEIYLERFPDGRGRTQITTKGGWNPLWSRDGRRLFFWNRTARGVNQSVGVEIWSVEIDLENGNPRVGRPQLFAAGRFREHFAAKPNFDVSPDGGSLLLLTEGVDYVMPREIHVVLNWTATLADR